MVEGVEGRGYVLSFRKRSNMFMHTWLNVESHDPFMTKETQATCEGLEKNTKKRLGEARGRI